MPMANRFPTPSAPESESIFSVSNLNKRARSLLESNFPAVAVEGEISNLATPASGHWYFTLKDRQSQIRCAMFRNRNQLLRFKPRNGMQLIVRGKLSIYEGRGDYQLISEGMEEAGDGALRRAFEELKAKLNAEGLFDEENKQEIGSDFQHIGIITSATGAAVKDIVSVFNRRFPAIRLTLFPVAVQGADAPLEIANAINLANTLRQKLQLEALIVGRGGGSLEDLQAFNDETVARAIFDSELPITSAVGHEIDFTIADFVADLRAPTPSAAAELMSPDQEDTLEYIHGYQQQLQQIITSKIQEISKQVIALKRHLKRPDRRLQQHAQTLDRLEAQMERAIKLHIQHSNKEIQVRHRALNARAPMTTLTNFKRRLQITFNRMQQGINVDMEKSRQQLAELTRGLNAVSPLQVLSRGYSITYDVDGNVIRQSTAVNIGDQIQSTMVDGKISSTVTEIKAQELD